MARYMYGSEAPARYEEPVRVPRRTRQIDEESYERELHKNKIEENRQRATKIGGLFAVFAIAMIAVLTVTCTKYIQLINTRSENSKKIAAMKEELQDKREANDVKKLSIDTSIDFNHIYDTAVKELGMIYADPDQIIKYHSGESEYVMQYKDIPEN